MTVGHFNEKHWGLAFFELKNVQRFFPPWTIAKDVCQTALRPDVSGIAVDTRLFHEAGCRLLHKYNVYKDPFPHPALREGVIPRLLSFVDRAMVIAQLTHLNISIPASGMPPGQVPAKCFPGGASSREFPSSRRVSFASDVTVLGHTPAHVPTPDIVLEGPTDASVMTDDDIAMEAAAMDMPVAVVPPPPGFREFLWPRDDWMVGSDTSSDTTWRYSLVGPPARLWDCQLIHHRCRCHLSSWIVRTIRWLPRWDRQERSRVFCQGTSDLVRFRRLWRMLPYLWIRRCRRRNF